MKVVSSGRRMFASRRFELSGIDICVFLPPFIARRIQSVK